MGEEDPNRGAAFAAHREGLLVLGGGPREAVSALPGGRVGMLVLVRVPAGLGDDG
jgi:hypothetical protein